MSRINKLNHQLCKNERGHGEMQDRPSRKDGRTEAVCWVRKVSPDIVHVVMRSWSLEFLRSEVLYTPEDLWHCAWLA